MEHTMPYSDDDAQVVTSRRASNAMGAAIDAQNRVANALANVPELSDLDHLEKVDMVYEIVENFFPIHKEMYTTPRENGKKPFTSVKIESPRFPATMSYAEKQRTYYQPLADLGVEPKYYKNTNSWQYRVYV